MWVKTFSIYWVLLLLCWSGPATASEAAAGANGNAVKTATTGSAMSRVVFNYPEDPHSATRSGYPMVFLAEVATPKGAEMNRLEISRKNGFQTLEVPAGRYYIRQVATDYFGFPSAPRPAPDNDAQLLVIPPGAVAYLGNVRWSTDTGLRMGFSKQGLLALQKRTELHQWPLFLVAFGAEPRLVSWD